MGCTASTLQYSSSSSSLDGRMRRRLGKQKMKARIKALEAQVQELETQFALLTDLLGQQFSLPEASHASPAHFDALASTHSNAGNLVSVANPPYSPQEGPHSSTSSASGQPQGVESVGVCVTAGHPLP
eukprot:949850-Karenia_brevis.AAC.1